jgi:hypothetical protein
MRSNEWKQDHYPEPPGGYTMIRGPVTISSQDAAHLHDIVKRAAGISLDDSQWALELIREGSK